MKILFFIQSLSAGGAERVTATLANYWANEGWEVLIVTIADEKWGFYSLDGRIRRITLDMARQSRHVGQAVLNNLRRILALRQILRKEKPDVAVAMMPTANATLALAGRLAGVLTVGSERIHPPTLPLGGIWEWVRRRTYPLLNGLVVQTEGSAAWLRSHAPVQIMRVIPNPVYYPLKTHELRLSPSEVLARLPGQRVLLAVGRLEEQKAFDRLVNAFGEVCDKYKEWSLVILGQGALHAALIQQVNELGIQDRVSLPGAVGNVGEWYEVADLYVLTSRFEGFPNTLMEALAYGVPAVAVDCETGPREIVRHEVDGLLVPQNERDALVAALDRMMGDASLRARFSERAVEARERYAVDRIAGQWEALFRKVVSVKERKRLGESRA